MKKMIQSIFGLVLILAVAVMPLQGMQKKVSKSAVESPAERVDKEVSLLDQIVELVDKIIRADTDTIRAKAKKDLKALMARKDLDEKIKKEIRDDVAIILNTTYRTIKVSQDAFDHLLETVASMDAQAHVVAVTQQATEMVQTAPVGKVQWAMNYAAEKIKQAEDAARSMAKRAYSGAKSLVIRPVNYVFGEESSQAKTAFYATVGSLVLAAGMYGSYQYGYGSGVQSHVMDPELIKVLLSNIDDLKEKNSFLWKKWENNQVAWVDRQKAYQDFLISSSQYRALISMLPEELRPVWSDNQK